MGIGHAVDHHSWQLTGGGFNSDFSIVQNWEIGGTESTIFLTLLNKSDIEESGNWSSFCFNFLGSSLNRKSCTWFSGRMIRVLKKDLSTVFTLSVSANFWSPPAKLLKEKSMACLVSPGANTVKYCSLVNPLRDLKSALAFCTSWLTLSHRTFTEWRTLCGGKFPCCSVGTWRGTGRPWKDPHNQCTGKGRCSQPCSWAIGADCSRWNPPHLHCWVACAWCPGQKPV